MLLGLGAAKAQDISEDWTTAKTWAVTSWTKGNTTPVTKTSTETEITYEFMGTYVNDSYLFIQGKNTAGAYISFTLPYDCSEIIAHTTSGNNGTSTNVNSKINVYAGDTKIIDAFAVNERDKDFKLSIPAAYRAKGTVYKIESNTKSYNQQFTKFTYVKVSAEPSLSIATDNIAYATPLNATQEFIVKGSAENIDGNITASVDNNNFKLSSTSFTADELTDGITVSYTGQTKGEETGTLTFKAGNLTQTVALSAITVANEGTEANPLTVADVLAMKNFNVGPFYVIGTIGDKSAANAVDGVLQTSDPALSNLILKDSENTMIAVALPAKSTARTTLNILDNPTNVGQTVIIKGSLENYFGIPGVKNTEYISGLSTSGIADIVADENAPVEYFNLQGIRVENPSNGLYIRRQGNKVTKVIVK